VAAGEGAEELVIEIVPVGDNHNGRVLHARMEHDLSGEEDHCQAFSRSLGVPDDATSPVTFRPGRGDRAPDSVLDCMVLVVPCHLLHHRSIVIDLEDDVIPNQV